METLRHENLLRFIRYIHTHLAVRTLTVLYTPVAPSTLMYADYSLSRLTE
jgi:hypothetical protein